ncbi:MAG: TIGR03435 family protein [Acidobacteriota bacterium]
MNRLLAWACLAIACSVVWAQGAEPMPTFEVADVHVSARAIRPGSRGGVLRGDRWEIRNATMVDLIQLAYGVEGERLVGGPRRLEMNHYDIAAKAPRGTPQDKVRLMLQNLLAERFQLKVHDDKREVPGFALVLGKGPHKLKKSDVADKGCKSKPAPPDLIGRISYSCRNVPADTLTSMLRVVGNGYFNAQLVNLTGLEGNWDFDLQWTDNTRLAAAGSDGISLFDAVEKQLGLKIEQRPISTPVLALDRVNEKPTENAPGIAEKLVPAKLREFEVGTIKPNPAPVGNINVNIQGDGRLVANAVSLRQLIAIAWDIPPNRISDDLPALDAHSFDVVAKAEIDPISGLDIEEFRFMMRGWLIDRFKMKLHMEDRQVQAYTLVAGKPKLTKADPSNRASCKDGPAPASQDARNKTPDRNRLITCRNVTMSEFADLLDQVASGYVKAQVLDSTHLQGEWDFTVNFTGNNLLKAALAATEPNDAISLEDAVKEQLGLKLEMGKRPSPMLVVEQASANPTEN